MLKEWPGCFIPCLPDKQIIGSNSLKVVKERMKELTYFLNSVAKIPYLLQSEEFHFFLTSPNSDLVRYYEFK